MKWLRRLIWRSVIKEEHRRLSAIINQGFDEDLPMNELCAAFRALSWVLNPRGNVPPHLWYTRKDRPKLRVIKGDRTAR